MLRPVVHAVLAKHANVTIGSPPETYTAYPDFPDAEAGRPAVYVRCDRGHIGSLGPKHLVGPDGVVHPSIGCHVEGCGWHVWGRLASWGT